MTDLSSRASGRAVDVAPRPRLRGRRARTATGPGPQPWALPVDLSDEPSPPPVDDVDPGHAHLGPPLLDDIGEDAPARRTRFVRPAWAAWPAREVRRRALRLAAATIAGALVGAMAGGLLGALIAPASAAAARVRIPADAELVPGVLDGSDAVAQALAIMRSGSVRTAVAANAPDASYTVRQVDDPQGGDSDVVEIRGRADQPAAAVAGVSAVIAAYSVTRLAAVQVRADLELATVDRQLSTVESNPGRVGSLDGQALASHVAGLRDRRAVLAAVVLTPTEMAPVVTAPAAVRAGRPIDRAAVAWAAVLGALFTLATFAVRRRLARRSVAPAPPSRAPAHVEPVSVAGLADIVARRRGRHSSVVVIYGGQPAGVAADVAARIVGVAGPEVAVALELRTGPDARDGATSGAHVVPLLQRPADEALAQLRDELDALVAGLPPDPRQLVTVLRGQGMSVVLAVPETLARAALWRLGGLADDAVVLAGDDGKADLRSRLADLDQLGIPVIGMLDPLDT